MSFPVRRGVSINVPDPEGQTDGTNGVGKGEVGLPIPRRGIRDARRGQQVTRPQ